MTTERRTCSGCCQKCWISEKCLKRGIAIDSMDPTQILEYEMLKPYFGYQHCEFNEDIDKAFPEPLMK